MCVCGWSGDIAGSKIRKKKKPKDSLRVNLFTIVVVFVIIVNIVVVVFLLIQDNF